MSRAWLAGDAGVRGGPPQTGTIWYPAMRMPWMMAGRAATVCARLPPPSCMITMAPGCSAASTRQPDTTAENWHNPISNQPRPHPESSRLTTRLPSVTFAVRDRSRTGRTVSRCMLTNMSPPTRTVGPRPRSSLATPSVHDECRVTTSQLAPQICVAALLLSPDFGVSFRCGGLRRLSWQEDQAKDRADDEQTDADGRCMCHSVGVGGVDCTGHQEPG